MSAEWTLHPLGELATFKYGKFLAKADLDPIGFPVFSGYGIVGYLPTYQFERPQLVIVCRGEGGTGDVKMSPAKCSITNLSIVLTPDETKVAKGFLFWALRGSDTHRLRTGSAQAQIVIGSLKKLGVMAPRSMGEQIGIAAVLDSLDDRIALLRETNATLEAIAQTLFKSWFVDFDPVRAKQQGLAPTGMDEATAALFPNGFEDSALGPLPAGWQVGELQDLLVLQRGFDLPAQDRIPGAFPIIAASGPSGTHVDAMAKGPGVVTGRSGVLGRVFLELGDYWPLNTTLWVKEFRAATPCYAYEVLKRLDFQAFNAGSAVPTLNRNHIHGLPYVVPARRCIDTYEVIALQMHERVRVNEQQAQTLATLRDTLLPRLISGQLRLPEAEASVAQA